MDDDQKPVPTPAPLVRQPLIPAMFSIVPAIIVALLVPAPMGIFIAIVFFVGQSVTLYRVFDKMKKRMEAEHPGIFDRPRRDDLSGPGGGPFDDALQGPIIS